MDILIFVTVGTSDFQFNRLLKIIDELCEEKVISSDEVFAQIGSSDYKPKNYKYTDTVDNDQHKQLIDKCEFIITHAGTGSIISALKKRKKIIAFPRMKKYGEHVDNHQLELVKAFLNRKYIVSATNKIELIDVIKDIKNFTPQEYISNNENMIKIIENYISMLL